LAVLIPETIFVGKRYTILKATAVPPMSTPIKLQTAAIKTELRGDIALE
jgi:hypothetical protein